MPTFVRVAHRQGWEIEVVQPAGVLESDTLASREEALAHAKSQGPDWIEVGDIVGLGTPAQEHTRTTLRRGADSSYSPSTLKWQGKGND